MHFESAELVGTGISKVTYREWAAVFAQALLISIAVDAVLVVIWWWFIK
jgi:hypothetical protein